MTATLPRAAVRALMVTLAALISLSCAQLAAAAAADPGGGTRGAASAPRAAADPQLPDSGEADTPGCRKSGKAVQQPAPGVRPGADQAVLPPAGHDSAGRATPADAAGTAAQGRTPPGPDIAQLSVLRL
ncbi:hypothetical protein [Streptomyces sp. MAR4 CNX-425]|uniref:hypothetical protein n=1 Tax=Streptomyces sp. MAR4 CNX-425 TaxID=3406343 RepID=UPI003B50D02A